MLELKMSIIDESEMEIVKEVFEKQIGQLWESSFTCYNRDPMKVLKKQLSIVEVNQVCNSSDKDSGRPNVLASWLGWKIYHIVYVIQHV